MRERWGAARAPIAAGAVLAAVVVALYHPVWGHEFVEFDDPLYVTANDRVASGLSLDNLRWAFTNDDAFLWHPLTWVSFLVSAELHGSERARPWLATNVVLHAANVALALWALLALTVRIDGPGRRWACVFAAGVFALHPLQVESVAWVSARKELLAASFFCLTLIAYARYARQPSGWRYTVVALTSALGMMAKGTHVALPFLLLLFDAWPLGRFPDRGAARRLILEKLPLLAIQVAGLAVNFAMASGAYNVWVRDPELATRIAAAALNLHATLLRVVWPTALSITYASPLQPIHPLPDAMGWIAAIATLLCVATIIVVSQRARSALVVGVLGGLGLLLPISGIVPMGLRSPHDRYLMVPLLVLAMGFAFGARAAVGTSKPARGIAATFAAIALVACAAQTWRQIPVWRTSETLFEHALDVDANDPIIHYSYGTALARRDDVERAIPHLERAVALHSDYADAHHNLGYLLMARGEDARGRTHLEHAVRIRPDWERALLHLGEARLRERDVPGAIAAFEGAVAAEPTSAAAHAGLGVALLSGGRRGEAEVSLQAALELDPDHAEARRALTWIERARSLRNAR